jgi:hypothetical protein
MNCKWSCLLLSVATFILLPSLAVARESAPAILKSEKKHLECMASVARTEPHVDQVRYETADINGAPVPILKYRYVEEQMVATVQFTGLKATDNNKWFYQTAFGGVSCAAKALEFVVASEITQKWQTKCGVFAGIFCA